MTDEILWADHEKNDLTGHIEGKRYKMKDCIANLISSRERDKYYKNKNV